MHHMVSERTIKELHFQQIGKGSGYSSHQGGHFETSIQLRQHEYHIEHSSVLHDRPVFVTGVGCGLPTMPASLNQFLGPTQSLHYCPGQQTQSRTAQLGGWKGVEPEHLKEKQRSFGIISYKVIIMKAGRVRQHHNDSPNIAAKKMMKKCILRQTNGNQSHLI